MSAYHDRYGLEADSVLHLKDGRYALLEFKLGNNEIEEGAKHLLEIERLIKEHNENEEQVPIRLPDLNTLADIKVFPLHLRSIAKQEKSKNVSLLKALRLQAKQSRLQKFLERC